MFKAIIFDLDGTLLDTKEGIIKSLSEIIDNRGFRKLSYEKMLTFVGPPMAKSLEKEYGLSKEEAFSAAQEFRDLYAGPNSLLACHYDNMEKVLKTLKSKGYKLGVATYKREDVSRALLKHFGLDVYFDSIHGSDFNGKMSKADIVSQTMEDLSAIPSNTLVIGDTKGDGLAANEVGTKFVAVKYGYGFKDDNDIDLVKPSYICEKAEEILNILY